MSKRIETRQKRVQLRFRCFYKVKPLILLTPQSATRAHPYLSGWGLVVYYRNPHLILLHMELIDLRSTIRQIQPPSLDLPNPSLLVLCNPISDFHIMFGCLHPWSMFAWILTELIPDGTNLVVYGVLICVLATGSTWRLVLSSPQFLHLALTRRKKLVTLILVYSRCKPTTRKVIYNYKGISLRKTVREI